MHSGVQYGLWWRDPYLWVFVGIHVGICGTSPQEAAREVRMLVENADATGERGNDMLKGDTAVVRERGEASSPS